MAQFTSETAKEMGAIGGKASAKARAEAQLLQDKSFDEVVKENMNNQTLKELYDALIRSGKKGNVKAVETILKYLDKDNKPIDNFDEF